jgi:TfoX/Sxy family transcriptional regulator of competence genes
MAYDEDLAARVRDCMQQDNGLSEKKMFGGLAFLIDGRMAVAASGQGGLLVRVDPAQTDGLARRPHAGRFVMRGREMNGWLHVDPPAVRTEAELERWVRLGVAYVRTLPPK